MTLRHGIWVFWLQLSILMSSFADAPKVVVSIAPIHSLTANVMQGIGEPELLVKGTQSPHHFSLTPSQVQKVKEADLVIWVGHALETFLTKPIQSFGKQDCALIDLPGLRLLSIRGKPCQHGCQHDGLVDPHIWLDIHNAILIVDGITRCLSEIDKQNARKYQENAINVKKRLKDLEQEILQKAHNFKGIKFICLHDAFHYYEQMVGVSNVGVLASTHSLEPSLKHLTDLKNLLKQDTVSCIFSEPQSQSKLLNNLAEEFNLYQGVIDPLGADIEPGIHQYFLLLQNITKAFTNCLRNRNES